MLNLNRKWSDDDLRKLAPLVLAPGVTDSAGTVRGRELRNPFCADGKRVSDEPRKTLARRWSTLNWNPPVASLTDDMRGDPFDLLHDALSDTPKLFRTVEKDGAVTAVHPAGIDPKDAAAVADWEAGAIEMHDKQTIILPPEKGGTANHVVPAGERAIPKFEDSAEAKKLKRGD